MRTLKSRCFSWVVVIAVLIGAIAPAVAGQPTSFSVVVLPDTQLYSEKFPDTYLVQTKWIKQRAKQHNIKMAVHLGDIVQNAGTEKEWRNADRAHRLLDGAVPYTMLPGNHDMTKKGETILYNKYFSPRRFKDRSWYGGHMGQTNNNNYCLFEAGGLKFMVLSLEFNPNDKALRWAGRMAGSHKDRRVMLATHEYMGPKARRAAGNNIFNKLVRKHDNIFMTLSGHIIGVGHQTSSNDAGGKVHEILCDYQGMPHGGDGWLQTLRFVPRENKIHVEAYSPLLDKYNKDPQHTYTLDYRMTAGKLKKAG